MSHGGAILTVEIKADNGFEANARFAYSAEAYSSLRMVLPL